MIGFAIVIAALAGGDIRNGVIDFDQPTEAVVVVAHYGLAVGADLDQFAVATGREIRRDRGIVGIVEHQLAALRIAHLVQRIRHTAGRCCGGGTVFELHIMCGLVGLDRDQAAMAIEAAALAMGDQQPARRRGVPVDPQRHAGRVL